MWYQSCSAHMGWKHRFLHAGIEIPCFSQAAKCSVCCPDFHKSSWGHTYYLIGTLSGNSVERNEIPWKWQPSFHNSHCPCSPCPSLEIWLQGPVWMVTLQRFGGRITTLLLPMWCCAFPLSNPPVVLLNIATAMWEPLPCGVILHIWRLHLNEAPMWVRLIVLVLPTSQTNI